MRVEREALPGVQPPVGASAQMASEAGAVVDRRRGDTPANTAPKVQSSAAAPRRLVVVSNRVGPISRSKAAQGGLAVAIRAALEKAGGIWFGYSGTVSERPSNTPGLEVDGNIPAATLDLTRRDYDEYYIGFANRVLWPLFHYRPSLIGFTRRDLAGYLRVNRRFARALAPNQRDLVASLCAYDLVGFQTASDLHGFRDYLMRWGGGEDLGGGAIRAFDRIVHTGVFPVGIDVETIAAQAEAAETSRQMRRLTDSIRDRVLLIGVDRIDYSKGLPARFAAYSHMLEQYPQARGRTVFMQIATASRSDVPEYREIRRTLEEIGRASCRERV